MDEVNQDWDEPNVTLAGEQVLEEDRLELPVPPKTAELLAVALHVRADSRWQKSK